MIRGAVTDANEAVIQLTVRGVDFRDITVDAVIDTGFNGYLTLPSGLLKTSGLTSHGVRRAQLADGSFVVFNLYLATIIWDGKPRHIQVFSAEGAPLVGMTLLAGHRIAMSVIAGGEVIIEPLS